VGVKGEGFCNPHPFHDGKGATIHQAENLIGKIPANPPGGFQINRLNG